MSITTNHHKGINFKQTPVKKLLLIQPDTFSQYLSTLPITSSGKIIFDFVQYTKLTKTFLFAGITPASQTEDLDIVNCRPINFIKRGKRKFVIIHVEMFHHFFAFRQGWVPYSFRFLTNSENDFAEITPEKQPTHLKTT